MLQSHFYPLLYHCCWAIIIRSPLFSPVCIFCRIPRCLPIQNFDNRPFSLFFPTKRFEKPLQNSRKKKGGGNIPTPCSEKKCFPPSEHQTERAAPESATTTQVSPSFLLFIILHLRSSHDLSVTKLKSKPKMIQ